MASSPSLPERREVVVVGAGLSGLACGRILRQAGMDVHLVEAASSVGGRVRTDVVDGFRLDRGFQVLLTAYEELQAQVDLSRLDLRSFTPGSRVWTGGSWATLGDPFRDPASALASVRAPVGTISDKLKVARLRQRLVAEDPEACFRAPDRSTREVLEAAGFSEGFIQGFFRPFMGGVFLEGELETSANLFRYYFRCFSTGDAAVPALGMQRLPELLAESLRDRITLGARVRTVSPERVTLDGGRSIAADHVVLAVDGPSAADLFGAALPPQKATVTSYFAADRAPVDDPVLLLNGEGSGPVNHVAVLSNVAPEYAPEGQHLVSVSALDGDVDDDVASFSGRALAQMEGWFGPSVTGWRHLKSYRISHALPRHPPGTVSVGEGPRIHSNGLVVAGDHTEFGSIQGALLSGRKVARAVLDAR